MKKNAARRNRKTLFVVSVAPVWCADLASQIIDGQRKAARGRKKSWKKNGCALGGLWISAVIPTHTENIKIATSENSTSKFPCILETKSGGGWVVCGCTIDAC